MNVFIGITPLCRKKSINNGDGISTYISMLINNKNYNEKVNLNYYTFGLNKSKINNNIYSYKVSYITYLLLGLLKFNLHLNIQNYKKKIIHAPDHRVPHSKEIVVSTIHDVIPIKYPKWENGLLRQIFFPILFRQAINRSDYIITPSQYSANEIIKYTKYPKERIAVIYHGINNLYFKNYHDDEKIITKNKYKIIGSYYLSVGTLQPRKNYDRLIDSYLALPKEIKRNNSLVIIGKPGWLCKDLIKRIKNLSVRENIFWLDYVPIEDLYILYAGATSLVFISLEEGFGLPILEAFASKIPVIASKSSSIEEIASNAALLVNPNDPREIKWAMQEIIVNNNLRNDLINRGSIRINDFNWDLAAEKTIAAYRKAINMGKKIDKRNTH